MVFPKFLSDNQDNIMNLNCGLGLGLCLLYFNHCLKSVLTRTVGLSFVHVTLPNLKNCQHTEPCHPNWDIQQSLYLILNIQREYVQYQKIHKCSVIASLISHSHLLSVTLTLLFLFSCLNDQTIPKPSHPWTPAAPPPLPFTSRSFQLCIMEPEVHAVPSACPAAGQFRL